MDRGLSRERRSSGARSPGVQEKSDLSGGEFAVFADFEASEVKGADAGADEFEDFAVDGLDHAADLAVASFGDGDFEVGVFRGVADPWMTGRAGGAVGNSTPWRSVQLFVGQQCGGFTR